MLLLCHKYVTKNAKSRLFQVNGAESKKVSAEDA